MTYVFVYGTLMRGLANYPLIKPYSKVVRTAMAQGRICHLPEGYPMLFAGEGLVFGELVEIADEQQALLMLDELEDYYGPDCAQNYYERRFIPVTDDEGGQVQAWAYFCPPGKEQEMWARGIPVPEGDWRKFLAGQA